MTSTNWNPKVLTPAVKYLHGHFVKIGAQAVAVHQIARVDFENIAELKAQVFMVDGTVLMASDIDALELAMTLRPSVLESRRLRWPKWGWAVHNLLGHPLMQVLAWLRLYKWAFWWHDDTVPRPTGRKSNENTTVRH